jgi:glycosyltransferase involved in cell wall biosynthesis
VSELVSIVMPVWNREDFLEEAIESVLAQTYGHWELLVVDDGSTDRSPVIVRRYAAAHRSIHLLEHPGHAHLGSSAARNRAIAAAEGTYVAFLDSDDVWFPASLDRLVELLERDAHASAACGSTLWWYSWADEPTGEDFSDEAGFRLAAEEGIVQPPRAATRFLDDGGAVPCTCSFIATSEAIRRIGALESEFRGAYDDQVLYMKLALRFPIYVTDAVLSKHRRHPRSTYALSEALGQDPFDRRRFLVWLRDYSTRSALGDEEFRAALDRALGATVGSATP